MHFRLIDRITSRAEDRVTAIKVVSASEEYLQDHFPGFPVLPGVFMLEALVQTARELPAAEGKRLVLGRVRALKYGSFVRPGDTLTCKITLGKINEDGTMDVRGKAMVAEAGGEGEASVACSGRLTLRPIGLVGSEASGHPDARASARAGR